MQKSTFRSLSIGDALKFVGSDPSLIYVTNQFLKVKDNVPTTYVTINDNNGLHVTIPEDDEMVEMLFPFDPALPQPEATAIMHV